MKESPEKMESMQENLAHPENEQFVNRENIAQSPELRNFLQNIMAMRAFVREEKEMDTSAVETIIRDFEHNLDMFAAYTAQKDLQPSLKEKLNSFMSAWMEKNSAGFKRVINTFIKRDPHLFRDAAVMPETIIEDMEEEMNKAA